MATGEYTLSEEGQVQCSLWLPAQDRDLALSKRMVHGNTLKRNRTYADTGVGQDIPTKKMTNLRPDMDVVQCSDRIRVGTPASSPGTHLYMFSTSGP